MFKQLQAFDEKYYTLNLKAFSSNSLLTSKKLIKK